MPRTSTSLSKYSPENNGKLSDLISLGGWKQGVVNRLGKKIPNDALLDALNVDITNNGNVRLRDGYSKIVDGICHSIYAFNNHVYFVKNNDFCKMDKNFNVTILKPSYTTKPVYYVELLNELYFCTGDISSGFTNKINRLGNMEDWGIRSPIAECEVIVGEPGSGGMKKGTYRINYSYLYGNYESSVYPLDTVFTVDYDDFNIEASCIASSQSTSAKFYISGVNGAEVYFAQTGYDVEIDYYDKTSHLPKRYTDEMPALANICFANGRIWGTHEDKIYFSCDRDYRQCNPALYIGVDSTPIVLFKAIDAGLYVVTEKSTYFMTVKNPDTMEDVQLTEIFPYSAIKGTLFEDTDKRQLGWLSTEGYIVGDYNGRLDNLSQSKIDLSKNYTHGTSLLRKRDGVIQVIFALQQEGDKNDFQTHEKDNEV